MGITIINTKWFSQTQNVFLPEIDKKDVMILLICYKCNYDVMAADIALQGRILDMSNSFDEQIQDECLRFIRDVSSQNNSDLFKNNQEVVKIEEEDINMNQVTLVLAGPDGKRKRKESQPKSNSKKKTFYRDKMASLISEKEMQERSDYNYGDYSQNVRGKQPISRQQQLKRNRESAKHSRQRRRQYIETLQLKNIQNQKKIEELSYRLRQIQLERDRLKDDNRSYMKTFMAAKNEAYQNLNGILQKSGNKSTDKLNEELQMLIARYGAAGSERIATTDYYMKQIIEILLADVHKYIVECVVNDSGLFGLGEWTKMDDEICEILKVNKEARVRLSRNYKNSMIQQFDTFKTITQKFYDAYRAVQNQAKIIEKVFEKISVQFNDVCIAQLLLWLEQNKFSKQLKRIRAWWARSVEQPEQPTGKSRKMNHFEAMLRQ